MKINTMLSFVPIAVFIVFGIIGNVINVLIFSKRKMRHIATFRYLLYLSVSDLFVLLFTASDNLIKSNISLGFREYSLFPCNIHKFLAYSTSYVSSCLSIAVSIEKALVVSRISLDSLDMSQSKNSCPSDVSSRKALLRRRITLVDRNVAILVVAMLLINIHFVFLIKPTSIFSSQDRDQHKNGLEANGSSFEIVYCMPAKELFYAEFLANAWIFLDICMYSLLPFSFMSVCSVIIIVKLKKVNKIYVSLMDSSVFNRSIYLKKLKRNFETSLMLLSTSFYFLVTMVIFWICFFFYKDRRESLENNLVHTLVYMLLYSNNAFGILFYALCSQKYRTLVFNLI